MNGISLNGIHSSTIPVTWKTNKRAIVPTPKTYSQAAPESDSEYDFSEFNDDGRQHYFDRTFEGTITLVARDMTKLNILQTKLARWLFGGWKTLEFDDMPGTLWTVKVENPEQVNYELGMVGSAVVFFRVKPFAKWFLNSLSGGVPIDSKVLLESDIPIDLVLDDTINFTAGNHTYEVNNLGDCPTKPVITITGAFTTLTIGIGSNTYTYTGNIQQGDTLVVDCVEQMVKKNGVNVMPNVSGYHFELSPGINALKINTNGTGQAKVLFDYKFIYMAVI